MRMSNKAATWRTAPRVRPNLGYDMAFHEKAGRGQAESLSTLIHKQGFPPPS